jgi:hypothetical protein
MGDDTHCTGTGMTPVGDVGMWGAQKIVSAKTYWSTLEVQSSTALC